MEEKPGIRTNMSLRDFLKECNHLILVRLARLVWVGYNFIKIGIDTRATDVVITPCCVEIVQLRLDNVGTPAESM